MLTILKFVLRNTIEKKFRSFLIVFAIMIATALLFCSFAISGTMVKMFEKQTMREYGSADIIITESNKSSSSFFKTDNVKNAKNDFDYVIGSIKGNGIYKLQDNEIVSAALLGANIDDVQKMNEIEIKETMELKPFSGLKAVISAETSEEYNKKLGDSIEVNINGAVHAFKVAAIAESGGPFIEGGSSIFVIVPYETLASIYKHTGEVNIAYIKLKNPSEKEQAIKDISSIYSDYNVSEPIANENLRQQVGPMSMTFLLVSIIVLLISVFITYSSFKVITKERLPVIGTFRSIGATRKLTNLIMLGESIIYGLVGGVLGAFLGIGLLYGMSFSLFPQGGATAGLEFSVVQLAGSCLLVLTVSFLSALVPVVKASRFSVKDIVLNTVEQKTDTKKWKMVFGLCLIAFSILTPYFVPKSMALYINTIALIGVLLSIAMLIPYISIFVIWILEKLFRLASGNSGVIAAKNIRTNKSIQSNITLIVVGISCLLMINTVSFSVVSVLTNIFGETVTFDMQVSAKKIDDALVNDIKGIDGVTEVYGNYEKHYVKVEGKGDAITVLQGINKDKYLEYWKMDVEGKTSEVFNELDKGENIMITNTLKEKYGLDIGSSISLKMGDTYKSYKVVGYFNTLLSLGNYALISDKNFKDDMEMKGFSNIMIKTSRDPEEVEKAVKEKLAGRQYSLTLTKDIERGERLSYGSIFSVLNGFSLLTLLIGILGILNNLIISFIDRKRSLAIFRSLGMSRGQMFRVLLIESVFGGLIGGITGAIAGMLMISNMRFVLKAFNAPVPINYSFGLIGIAVLAGIAVYVLASFNSIKRSTKINIIQTLKYE